MASRNIVHLQKVILRCVGFLLFCRYIKNPVHCYVFNIGFELLVRDNRCFKDKFKNNKTKQVSTQLAWLDELKWGAFHITPEKFEKASFTGDFGFVFEENLVREITWLWWCFRKTPFLKMFSVHILTGLISTVWRALSKNTPFCNGVVCKVGLMAETKLRF